MSFDESKVKIVRLVSNEELVGLVSDSELNEAPGLQVEIPFQIGLRAQQTQQTLDSRPNLSIHMAPYLPLADEDAPLKLPASLIAFSYKPNEDIIAKYKEIYIKMTTNLILPK